MTDADDKKKAKLAEEFEDKAKEIEALLLSGQAGKALVRLKKLAKTYGQSAAFCFQMGRCYEVTQSHADAIEWYRKAIRLDPNRIAYYEQAVGLCQNLNNPDHAIEFLREGTRHADDKVMFRTWLEAFLSYTGREEDALHSVEDARQELSPGELLYRRGLAAFNLELHPTAIDFFRRSLAEGYCGKSVYYYLAICFGRRGYLDHAVYLHGCSLQEAPDHRSSLEDLHQLLLWGKKSGDECLLEALRWKRAYAESDVQSKVDLAYLNTETEKHEKEYAGIDGIEDDPEERSKQLPEIFAQFYCDLLLQQDDHDAHHFSARESLLDCISKLDAQGWGMFANFYRAWLHWLDGNYTFSENLFKSLRENWAVVEDYYRNGIAEGLRRIAAARSSPFVSQASSEDDERLNKYGFNLSRKVAEEKRGHKAGLEKTVTKLVTVLAGRSCGSILLTGPSGVGKTAAIKELSRFLLEDDSCPESVKGLEIFQTSTIEILSGAKYIGMWQERLIELCDLAGRKKGYIIYISDIANIFGAGRSEGDTSCMADLLIPRLENGEIILLGEMDSSQAQQLLAREPHFERVVTQQQIREPNTDTLRKIIGEVAASEGAAEKVEFSPESITETLDLARAFIPYKAFPGKAIDIIRKSAVAFAGDEKSAAAKIGTDEVVLAFCEMSGIPDFLVDRSQLLDQERMQCFFSERILGQQESTRTLMAAVTTFKARLNDPARPIRSFLFAGPTGVGKTESAKVLAEFLFGSQKRIIRLNMSEFSGPDAVNRLIGAESGNDRRTSAFLDKVRKRPFSVILLDEIEKANPDVFNLLLQLLDEGTLSDAAGKPTHFQSTIIIMTSNIGSRHYTAQSIGFGSESNIPRVQESVLQEIRNSFTPEVYNRFDEIICFQPLSREALGTIVNREIGKVLERQGVARTGVPVEVDPSVKDFIVEVGYDPKYGARHIKRAVERAVAVPLAELITSRQPARHSEIRINMQDGKPVATLVDLEEFERQQVSFEEAQKLLTREIEIPDRELWQTLQALESRIASLKSKFGYEDTSDERENLQNQMGRPSFWDDHAAANAALRRFAEVSRRLERIHRWERSYERIAGTLALPLAKLSKSEISRARSNLIGLIKDLESAEMEILLEGKYDFADAFILLTSSSDSEQTEKWLVELAGIYANWARHRGYHCRFFGEQHDPTAGGPMLIFHVGGLNAFGLLKHERGIHRKTILRKSGGGKRSVARIRKSNLDCNICVLADVQPLERSARSYDIAITRIKPEQHGWKVKKLSRRVLLRDHDSEQQLAFLGDSKLDSDQNLPVELFLSYLHFRKREKQANASGDAVWGSLVRTYETGERSRVVDYRTKIVIKDVRDYLDGKIDALLLERLV